MKNVERVMGTVFLTVAVVAAFVTSGCGSHDSMPSPPSNLMVVESTGGAHLTWKDNADNEASFMIERMVGAAVYANLATVPFDTTQYHDAPLMVGVAYKYRVMATSKSGGAHTADTKYSNEVPFMLPAP